MCTVGCASTNKDDSGSHDPITLSHTETVCDLWVHDVKEHATADYQVCKYNHKKSSDITACMTQSGWGRERKEGDACKQTSYTSAQRAQCIDEAIVDGAIEYDRMASCLAQFEPKYEETQDVGKILSQCLAKVPGYIKSQDRLQYCVNKVSKNSETEIILLPKG
jgi:hypothetical protein